MSTLFDLPQPPKPELPRHLRPESEGGMPMVPPWVLARDAAIARVGESASEAWKRRALEAVQVIARRQPELIANDIWELVEKPEEPRATGAVMKQAQKRGWIAPTDRFRTVPSITRHAAPVRIWRSLIWEGR